MKKTGLILLSVFLLSNCLNAQDGGYFTNPVIRGDLADPTVIKIGSTYYAAGTSSEWAPHYPVFSSTDLVNWTPEGHVFNEKPEWTVSSFWAPELFYHNGKVYCYYTARRASDNISCIGVATADSPTGKFTDHGVIVETGNEAIDAFVYDDGGQLYISWKAYGLEFRPIELLAAKLSDDGLRLESEPFSLLTDDDNIGMEGQYHFRQGDYYYIVYAAHGCCGPGSDYDVYVARATSFAGPYEKFPGNPILHGGEGDYQSCGHGTAVETPDGRKFYLCHAYLAGAGFFAGRQPVLHEMFVTEDGWVQFATGSLATARQALPFSGKRQKPVADFEDRFRGRKLRPEWSWNYTVSDINVSSGGGKLSLGSRPHPGTHGGTVLCVRPVSPNYEYQTRVNNENDSFKGLTFYGDDANFAALGVQGGTLVLKTVKNGEETTIATREAAAYLKIRVEDGCRLSFYCSADGKKWTLLGNSVDGRENVPWDRIARPGLIHSGEAGQPAVFSYFKLTNE